MLAFLWERRRHGDTENGVHERHRDYSSKYSADMAQHDKPHLMRFAGVCTEAANPLNGIDDHCTCTVNVFFFHSFIVTCSDTVGFISLCTFHQIRNGLLWTEAHCSLKCDSHALLFGSLLLYQLLYIWFKSFIDIYIAHGALILNSGIWS